MASIADTIETVRAKLKQTFEVWKPAPKTTPPTGQELQSDIDDANALLEIIDSRGIDAIRRKMRLHFDQYDSYCRNMEAVQHQGPVGTEAKGMARAAESTLRIFNDILSEGRKAEDTLKARQEQAEREEQKRKTRSRVHPLSSATTNRTD
jgi:hypothetical protein